jgi:hypothetical protein
MRDYVRGLLAPVERKNGWQLAEYAGPSTQVTADRPASSICWTVPPGTLTRSGTIRSTLFQEHVRRLPARVRRLLRIDVYDVTDDGRAHHHRA